MDPLRLFLTTPGVAVGVLHIFKEVLEAIQEVSLLIKHVLNLFLVVLLVFEVLGVFAMNPTEVI